MNTIELVFEIKPEKEKKFRTVRHLNQWSMRYRRSALPAELTRNLCPRSALTCMRFVTQTISIDIHMEAISLYSLIAHGYFRALSVGRIKWKSLIGSQASLQRECNKKGFNARGSSSHSEQALAFQAMKTVTATLGIPDSGLARFHVETWPDTGLIMET